MAKFFLYLGFFTAAIAIFGTAAYFSIFKNDDHQPLVTVIQNVSQEENNYQEKNINEEIINNPILLENMIINLLIFFLLFCIAVYFVFYSDYSPVVGNNLQENIGEKEPIKIPNKSFFRKKALFNGQKNFIKKEFYYLYYENEGNKNFQRIPTDIRIESERAYAVFKENFSIKDNYTLTEHYNEKLVDLTLEDIKTIRNNFFLENAKKIFLSDNRNIPLTKMRSPYSMMRGQEVEDFCSQTGPDYTEYFEYFNGMPSFLIFLIFSQPSLLIFSFLYLLPALYLFFIFFML